MADPLSRTVIQPGASGVNGSRPGSRSPAASARLDCRDREGCGALATAKRRGLIWFSGSVAAAVLTLSWRLDVNVSLQAACSGCTDFESGTAWGQVADENLTEASGVAVSIRNPGVIWAHNDGPRSQLYAIDFTGTLLGVCDLNQTVDDLEDIAIAPRPGGGGTLYVGDLGGSAAPKGLRDVVTVFRVPEPEVDPAWASAPRWSDLEGVERFALVYPDGRYDAETLMFDSPTQDLLVATKQDHECRIYRANLTNATHQQTLPLQFVCSVPFSLASAGAIARDGGQILLRREDWAMIWSRCDGESLADALKRPGVAVPVIGPPVEPNGEGIDFVGSGQGYVTLSEGRNPAIYFFQTQCPVAPVFTRRLQEQTNFVSRSVQFTVAAVGTPWPQFSWNHNGQPIPGASNASLVLSNLALSQAGVYQVVASNASGTVTQSATLTVLPRPVLRITEVQSSEAPGAPLPTGDWWELTSFESQTVDLSGFRFNDDAGGLSDAFVLPDGVLIQPGESMIFVEDLQPAEFISWWGAAHLPPALQIITYHGSGLSFNANGDSVRLWDNVTADPDDTLDRVDFGVADAGVTFNYDPVSQVWGGKSRLGVNGVIRAASAGDVGSPGRIIEPAPAPVLSGVLAGQTLRIEFDTVAAHRYALEVSNRLVGEAWTPTGDEVLATSDGRAFFTKPGVGGPRFYRVTVR